MTVLFERESELRRIARAIQEPGAARELLLVEGPAGIGKSSLLREARRLAADEGLLVLAGRGHERERPLPFGVARQLFEPHVRETELEGAAALARPALDAGTSASGATGDPFALLHGLYWLTVELSDERPLLIVVDDAHWSDGLTLRFVEYLHHRQDELPVVLLVAARPEESEPTLDALRADPNADILELSPLGLAAVERLVLTRRPDAAPQVASALHRTTGGNPFYLGALLEEERELDPEGIGELAPEKVRRFVLARLSRLGDRAVALAEAVAVLGAPPVRHAAALAGLEVEAAETLADRLAQARLLAAGRPLEFVHPIVRSAVHGSIPAGRLSGDHRRAARLLAEDRAPVAEVAAHLMQVEPAGDAWTAEQLRLAAADATGRGAPETAAVLLRRALAEPPPASGRTGILQPLAWALLRRDERDDAIAAAREALELARSVKERVDAAIVLREVLTNAGRPNEVAAALQPTLERLAAEDPGAALQVELTALAASMLHVDTAVAAEPRVREIAAMDLDHPHAIALTALGLSFYGATPAAALRERAADGAARWGSLPPGDQLRFVNQMLPALVSLELYDVAREMCDPAIARARRIGSLPQASAWLSFRAYANYMQGAVPDADADAREALEAMQRTGQPLFSPFARGFVRASQLERGVIPEIDDVAPVVSILQPLDAWAARRAQAAAGHLAVAAEGLVRISEEMMALAWRSPSFVPCRSDAALLFMRLGDAGRARTLVAEELELARAFGGHRPLGIALRAAGLIEADLDLLREAVSVLEHSGARLEHARALVTLGSALRRHGLRREARDVLTDGWDRARACGGTALAGHAREELHAAGARPRRDAMHGRDALTASELRVARMAADGLSNPEIAQALFVTRRTVETHLGSAYRKLAITSRSELAGTLG